MMKSKQLDQWFTIPETVALCMAHIDTSSFTDIIDPCAGDKAFKDHCSSFYDIDPRHPDIIEQDFMELNLPHDKNRLFLTNFPYGKSGKLSIQMINHASTMADTIATIVPNTLLRYSAQKKVNSELKLLLSVPLPKKSFTLDGKPVDVPSQFQIWSRDGSSCIRTEQLPNTHKDFIISSRYNPNATFVIRGVRPKVSNEVDVYSRISSNTRYYSVEPLVDGVEDVFRSIDLVSLCSKSTGMPCMSIPDCIKAYNDLNCLRAPEPTIAMNDDWKFDNKTPNYIVMTNTREVKRIEDMTPTNNCKKIQSHLSLEELVKRFGSVNWIGVPMLRGGGFSITNAELSTQYANHHNREDWFFDNKTPNAYIIGASRKVKPMTDFSEDWRGYKIHSNIPIDELQDAFNSIKWHGVSSVSGGVFWLGKDEIQKQYKAGMI